jgi:subtilisin-like proprotein convertase family protein
MKSTKILVITIAAIAIAGAAHAQLTYTSSPSVAIPDNDPTGVSDNIVVMDSGIITDLNVQITATHTWVGDLIFTLRHVDTGTTVVLGDRAGVPGTTFGCSSDNVDAWIDDEGTDGNYETTCNASPPAISGTLVGGDPPSTTLLAAFDGEDIGGTWTLTASDNASGDTGTLVSWTIEEPVIPVELQSFSIE